MAHKKVSRGQHQPGGSGTLELNSSDSAPRPKTKPPSATEVFPILGRDCKSLAHKPHTNPPSAINLPVFWNALQQHAEDAYRDLLRTADVEAWAKDHHLHRVGVVPQWLLEDAAHEREYFLRRGGSKRVSLAPKGLRLRPITLDPWACGQGDQKAWGWYDPGTQRRASAEDSIMAALRVRVRAEMDRIEHETGGEMGYKDDLHMQRFVRFQVAEVKVRELICDESEQPSTSRKDPDSAIRKSLKATAARLGITLRQDRRGAPRK